MDNDGCTPYEYMGGNPKYIKLSEYLQNKREIHHTPYSNEHCYYMELVNKGTDDKKAVLLTMEQFPSLNEDGPTQRRHDIDHVSALKEFTQYITKGPRDEPWRQPLPQRYII